MNTMLQTMKLPWGLARGKYKWATIFALLVGFAIIRYFYKLTAYPSFYNDEWHSYDIVTGFLNSGLFYKWDWASNSLSDTSYTRAWPYTILLAAWLKIFGQTLFAARAFSAFCGIVFIISFVYVSKKWFDSIAVTVIASVLLIMDTSVTFCFRYVRMYCLWMICMLWTMHFIYLGLTSVWRYKNKDMMFHYPYLFIASLLFLFSYAVHLNTCILLLGLVAYFSFHLVWGDKTKYFAPCIVSSVFILIGSVCYLCYINELLPEDGNVLSTFCRRVSLHIAPFAKLNYVYITSQLKFLGEYVPTVLALLCAFYVSLKRIKFRRFFVWSSCIYLTSLVFFVFFANRYYNERYSLFLNVFTALYCAFGFSFLYSKYKQKGMLISLLIVSICFARHSHADYKRIYTSYDSCDYIGGFIELERNLSIEDKGIIKYGVYNKYLFQDFISNHKPLVVNELSCHKKELFPYESLLAIAHRFPQGIIMCEKNKFQTSAHPEFKTLISTWTDTICSPSSDNHNFYISRYHFLFPQQVASFDLNFGPCSGGVGYAWRSCDDGHGEIYIYLHQATLAPNTEFIAIKVIVGDLIRHYQLVTKNQQLSSGDYYIYKVSSQNCDFGVIGPPKPIESSFFCSELASH